MRKALLIALMSAGAVFLAGCQNPGARPPLDTTRFDLENQAGFVLMDKGTQRSVTASGLQYNRLPDGRFEVGANVRNRENRRIEVQMNCEFKDEQGFAVDSTPWRTVILTENAQETVRFISLNDRAQRATVRVRQSR
jgi:hypothetical protein